MLQAILKIRSLNTSDTKIEKSFQDKDGETAEEAVHIYQDGDLIEILVFLQRPLLQLEFW